MAVKPEDRHPIEPGRSEVPLEQRVHQLECLLAEAWDQLWWLSLPAEQRKEYEAQGFPVPIQKFYGRD